MAPVTRVCLHPGKSMTEGLGNLNAKSEMSDLMLSSSMDWTVKLWYTKNVDKHDPVATFESS